MGFLLHTLPMENKKPQTYYERLTAARQSFYEWNQDRIEWARKNPIDWNATVKAKRLVGKNDKK